MISWLFVWLVGWLVASLLSGWLKKSCIAQYRYNLAFVNKHWIHLGKVFMIGTWWVKAKDWENVVFPKGVSEIYPGLSKEFMKLAEHFRNLYKKLILIQNLVARGPVTSVMANLYHLHKHPDVPNLIQQMFLNFCT